MIISRRSGSNPTPLSVWGHLHMEAEQMRHDAERYRMLLEKEKNPRVRKVLTDMIQELESRAPLSSAPESQESSTHIEGFSAR